MTSIPTITVNSEPIPDIIHISPFLQFKRKSNEDIFSEYGFDLDPPNDEFVRKSLEEEFPFEKQTLPGGSVIIEGIDLTNENNVVKGKLAVLACINRLARFKAERPEYQNTDFCFHPCITTSKLYQANIDMSSCPKNSRPTNIDQLVALKTKHPTGSIPDIPESQKFVDCVTIMIKPDKKHSRRYSTSSVSTPSTDFRNTMRSRRAARKEGLSSVDFRTPSGSRDVFADIEEAMNSTVDGCEEVFGLPEWQEPRDLDSEAITRAWGFNRDL